MNKDLSIDYYSSYRKDQGHDSFRRDLSQSYQWYFRGWLPHDREAKILEIGCGEGDILCALKAQGYGNISGFDLREDAVVVACGRGVNAVVGDARTFFSSTDAMWDLVLLVDVIEHLTLAEALSLLSAVRQRLSAGGSLLIQCPNVAGVFGSTVQFGDITHLTAFAPSSLEQLCRRAGFRTIVIREAGPGCWGALATLQYIAWQGLRIMFKILNVVEIGSSGHGIFTRVMMAKVSI